MASTDDDATEATQQLNALLDSCTSTLPGFAPDIAGGCHSVRFQTALRPELTDLDHLEDRRSMPLAEKIGETRTAFI